MKGMGYGYGHKYGGGKKAKATGHKASMKHPKGQPAKAVKDTTPPIQGARKV